MVHLVKRMPFKLFAVTALFVTSATPAPALAQNNSTADTIGALGNLFGALAQAGAKSKALKQWQAEDTTVIQCFNTVFSSKNVTADSFVEAGIGTADQRVAPVVTFCKAVMTAELKSGFACNVTNSKGQQVGSTCVQSFAVEENGSLSPVSRDDYLIAVGNEKKTEVANFETSDAQKGRLDEERRIARADLDQKQRQAELERKRFLASPEGKRQLAEQAAERKATVAASSLWSKAYSVKDCSNFFETTAVAYTSKDPKLSSSYLKQAMLLHKASIILAVRSGLDRYSATEKLKNIEIPYYRWLKSMSREDVADQKTVILRCTALIQTTDKDILNAFKSANDNLNN